MSSSSTPVKYTTKQFANMEVVPLMSDDKPRTTYFRDPIIQQLSDKDLLYEDKRIDKFDDIAVVEEFKVSSNTYYFDVCFHNSVGLLCLCPIYARHVFVESGEIRLIKDGSEDKALGPGYHSWRSLSTYDTGSVCNSKSKYVQSGCWVFVNVSPGTLMVVDFMDGSCKFLAPGAHQWTDPNIVLRLQHHSPVVIDLNKNVIEASPYTVINVFKSTAMVVADAHAHKIFAYVEGIHVMDSESSKFLFSLDLRDQTRQLRDVNDHADRFMIRTTSADSILVEFQVNYCFRIKDPQLAAERLGSMNEIESYINSELLADVTKYIRQQSVSDLVPADTRITDTVVQADLVEEGDVKARAITLPENWDSILNIKFNLKGIELEQPGMFEFKISDKDAREAMRQIAVAKVTALAQLESAETQAKAEMIRAKGESNVKLVTSEAEATSIRTIAEAQRDAVALCDNQPVAKQILLTKASTDMFQGSTKWVVNSPQDMIKFYEGV